MNFQMCQQAPGQWLMLKATATRYELKQGQYGLYALGDLRDANGQTEKMMFGASEKSPLPPQSLQGVPAIYSVQWDANKQKFKAYFKSFSVDQQAPPPQRQQPAPQRQQTQEQKPDWDAISRGKVRHGVVTAFIQSGNQPEIGDVEYWVEYIMTGQVPAGANVPDSSPDMPNDWSDFPPAGE